MRAGPQLGVAKAARAPPCTLLILGRRFYFLYDMLFIHLYIKSRWIRVISELFFTKRDVCQIFVQIF